MPAVTTARPASSGHARLSPSSSAENSAPSPRHQAREDAGAARPQHADGVAVEPDRDDAAEDAVDEGLPRQRTQGNLQQTAFPEQEEKRQEGGGRYGGEDRRGVQRRDLGPARRHRVDGPHPRAQMEQRIAAEAARRRALQRGEGGEAHPGHGQPDAGEPESPGPLAQQQDAEQRGQRREGAGNEDRGVRGRRMEQARAQHQREGDADGPRHCRGSPPSGLARLEAEPQRNRQQQQARQADPEDGQVFGRYGPGDGKPGQRKPRAPEHHRQKRGRDGARLAPSGGPGCRPLCQAGSRPAKRPRMRKRSR